jgi:4'-phosphopantetheinyl transferase
VIPATQLVAGPVQVLLVTFCDALQDLDRLRGFLSGAELQRGGRLLDQRRRDLFFASRGMLREMLGERIGEEPGAVALCEGEYGKPGLAGRAGGHPIGFNLSHAGDYLLFAFAEGCEIGVDLEQVRQDLPFPAMAKRYFSEREREELFSLPLGEQVAAFYRCWTRKEAYLKGTGTGFSQSSTAFDVSLLPDQPAALLAHRTLPSEPRNWSLQDLSVPQGYCAAFAAGIQPLCISPVGATSGSRSLS